MSEVPLYLGVSGRHEREHLRRALLPVPLFSEYGIHKTVKARF